MSVRQASLPLIISIALSLASPTLVSAVIIDVGDVGLGLGGELQVGIDAFGQRTIDGEADGPYPSVTVGVNAGGSGELLLVNNASLDTTGALIVADQGSGLVRVGSGSSLNTGTALVGAAGRREPASVIVEGAGSTWINSGKLLVRGDGNSFIVRNGGFASDSAVEIGDSFSRAKAIIDGPGSTWITGPTLLGSMGAVLTITNGGQVQSESVLMTTETNEEVVIDGTNSSWSIAGDLRFGGNGAGGGDVHNGDQWREAHQ